MARAVRKVSRVSTKNQKKEGLNKKLIAIISAIVVVLLGVAVGLIVYFTTQNEEYVSFAKTIIIPSNIDVSALLEKFPSISTETLEDKMALKFSLNEVNVDDILLELINIYHIEDFKINDISIEDITKNLYEKNEETLA